MNNNWTRNKKTLFIISFPLLLSLLITLHIIIFGKFLPPKLPFFYSLSWGEKQLANSSQLLIIPASIAAVTLFNLIVSWQLHDSQSFFKKTLLYSSILISLILTMTFLKIIFIFI